jgi:hypothetical protein
MRPETTVRLSVTPAFRVALVSVTRLGAIKRQSHAQHTREEQSTVTREEKSRSTSGARWKTAEPAGWL